MTKRGVRRIDMLINSDSCLRQTRCEFALHISTPKELLIVGATMRRQHDRVSGDVHGKRLVQFRVARPVDQSWSRTRSKDLPLPCSLVVVKRNGENEEFSRHVSKYGRSRILLVPGKFTFPIHISCLELQARHEEHIVVDGSRGVPLLCYTFRDIRLLLRSA